MKTLLPTSFFARTIAFVCCASLINISVPLGIPGLVKSSLPKPSRKPVQEAPKAKVMPPSRLLSAGQMKKAQGKYATNPYLAGSGKWDPFYKGVNLITRNFTSSATDLSFEGGYGIPVNVTRSYSANNGEESPFGPGWTMSADVRTTAGGLLKSSKSPVRSVPAMLKSRPSGETLDPNLASTAQPVEAVTATDASGKEETLQRDADGVVTTPAWDTNLVDTTYTKTDFNGSEWELATASKVTTLDGTVYQYSNEGYYSDDIHGHPENLGGVVPFNNPSATPEPSYVLKITSATDRQGNVTTYTYNTTKVKFSKQNGITMENQLTGVAMPNGHTITFHWGSGSSSGSHAGPIERIVDLSDNDAVRTVTYTYSGTSTDGSGVIHGGVLASVTSPGGLTTSYGYDSATGASNDTLSTDTAYNLLTSITDPRGLVTHIYYVMDNSYPLPYSFPCYGPCVWCIAAPNGINTYFYTTTSNLPTNFGDQYYPGPGSCPYCVFDLAGGQHGELINSFKCSGLDQGDGTCNVKMENNMILPFVSEDHPYVWLKTYEESTQNLLTEVDRTYPSADTRFQSHAYNRFGSDMDIGVQSATHVTTTTNYNFMGNPLNKTVDETFENGSSWPTYATKETDFAYWGTDKYYQQKATRLKTGSSSWRYSFTDYFDNTASAGSKGQTQYMYDPKNGGVWLDTSVSVPSGTASGDAWRYQVKAPSSGHSYSASFVYDSKGRPTDAYKLQDTSSTWKYVQTHTTYGTDTDGSWGQANEVVEDYGSGSGFINRTTQTLDYTSWGVADKVQDAAGHVFKTYYNLDGRTDKVVQVVSGTENNIVEYTYSTSSGVSNGQVTEVKDDLSGIYQDFTYQSGSGGGLGQISEIVEHRPQGSGWITYTSDYSYNTAGQREYATQTTPNATTQHWYHDYVTAGQPEKASQAVQTISRMDLVSGSWVVTDDEMHYAYDGAGRLRVAAFAQTPQSSSVLSNGTYYDDSSSTTKPSSRARAVYVYDPSGRLLSLDHLWDYPTTGGPLYQTDYLLGNACTYADYAGLKHTSTFYKQDGSNSHNPATDQISGSNHVETYGYDADLDYLTSTQYVTGGSTTSWSYDAAGNRNDVTAVDNLNRATTIGGVSRTYDILGNTTGIGSKTMSWDVLNRMTQYTDGSNTRSYVYRADGMRTKKANFATPSVYTDYGYDGQMPTEEFNARNSYPTLTFIKLIKYGVGARGIDRIERDEVNGTALVGYPLYDAHGNMVATIAKGSLANTYAVGDLRSYNVWGGVLVGNSTGEPNARYCANLGHLQDDESGFTYMRARYYDPSCGRFASEDAARKHWNWFAYCSNRPLGFVDRSGSDEESITEELAGLCGEESLLGIGMTGESEFISFGLSMFEGSLTMTIWVDWVEALADGSIDHAAFADAMEQLAEGRGAEAIRLQGETGNGPGVGFFINMLRTLGLHPDLLEQDSGICQIFWIIEGDMG